MLVRHLREVAAELQLELVPYQLRHSGASHDRLAQARTLDECRKRGRWRSHRSLVRYEKAARVAQYWNDLPAAMRAHCEDCDARLEAVVLGRDPGPPPPRPSLIGRAQRPAAASSSTPSAGRAESRVR